MKPHITCHMVSSIDGRILQSRWAPKDFPGGDLFEAVHDRLGGGSWIVGRVTGQEFAKRDRPYEAAPDGAIERTNHIVAPKSKAYGIVLDASGKISFGRADIGGDPIVAVLTRGVPDTHLSGLREDGVSYIFAGDREIDLAVALETLNRELGIERLLVEGGGGSNGSFLRAGLIDEISVVICPTVDGAKGAPAIFDSGDAAEGRSAPLTGMELKSHEVLEGGAVWLRYAVSNG